MPFFAAIQFFSPQVQRARKFDDADRFLNEADLHPHGHALAVSARSLVYTFTNWEGPVYQHGDPAVGVRYRLPAWLNDNLHLLALSDEGGEETFVILTADGSQPPKKLPALDTGRLLDIAVHPGLDQIVFSNHRRELMFLDLHTNTLKLIDRSLFTPVTGFSWAPDGEWVEVDENAEYEISSENMHSRSGWTPFEGWRVKGLVRKVVLRGETALEDGRVLVEPGYGRNVRE